MGEEGGKRLEKAIPANATEKSSPPLQGQREKEKDEERDKNLARGKKRFYDRGGPGLS